MLRDFIGRCNTIAMERVCKFVVMALLGIAQGKLVIAVSIYVRLKRLKRLKAYFEGIDLIFNLVFIMCSQCSD